MLRWAAGVLATAIAYFLSTGVNHVWPLAWIAPVPVLLFAFASTPRAAGTAAFCGFLLGALSFVPAWLPVVPPAVLGLSLAVSALAFALAVLVTRYAVLRFDHWAGMLVLPVLWTAWELVASRQGTYGSLAYSQTDALAVIQIASITGLAGITFLLTLVPAAVAVAWRLRSRPGHVVRALAVPAVLCAAVVSFGWMRLAQSASGPSVRVGLAATDETVRYFRTERPDEARAVVTAYAERVHRLAAQGAQVVVLPEKFVGVTPAYAGAMREILAGASRAGGVTVVAGFNHVERAAMRNIALVFSPRGDIQVEYDKVHLIPGLEAAYRGGRRLGFIPTAQGVWGVAICRDMDFPDLGRAYARAGVGLLLVPAWDFVRDGRLHARMAVMRGVEGGYAIARTAQQGLLTVSDHHGRILAEAPSSAGPEVLLVAEVNVGPGFTVYGRAGNWFARLNAMAAIGILAAAGVWYAVTAVRRRGGHDTDKED